MALQLDIEAVAEQPAQPLEALLGLGIQTLSEIRIDGAFGAAAEANDAVEILPVEPADLRRGAASFALEIGFRNKPREIGVAGLVSGDQHHAAFAKLAAIVAALDHPVGLRLEIEHQLGAEQRLHTLPGRLLGKFERAEEIVGIGDAEGRLFVGLGQIEQRAEL